MALSRRRASRDSWIVRDMRYRIALPNGEGYYGHLIDERKSNIGAFEYSHVVFMSHSRKDSHQDSAVG
jgi:hypothetical protein